MPPPGKFFEVPSLTPRDKICREMNSVVCQSFSRSLICTPFLGRYFLTKSTRTITTSRYPSRHPRRTLRPSQELLRVPKPEQTPPSFSITNYWFFFFNKEPKREPYQESVPYQEPSPRSETPFMEYLQAFLLVMLIAFLKAFNEIRQEEEEKKKRAKE